jgi:hypothetical protein
MPAFAATSCAAPAALLVELGNASRCKFEWLYSNQLKT